MKLITIILFLICMLCSCSKALKNKTGEIDIKDSSEISSITRDSVEPQIKVNGVINVSARAPSSKPVLSFRKKYKNIKICDIIVDSKGFVWLLKINLDKINDIEDDTNINNKYNIICLKQNGSIIADCKFNQPQSMQCLVLSHGNLIVLEKDYSGNTLFPVNLKAINPECDIVWSSQTIQQDYIYPDAWLITDNKAILTINDKEILNFQILDLNNGNVIDQLYFPCLDKLYQKPASILDTAFIKIYPVNDTTWFGMINNNIFKIDKNNIVWSHNLSDSIHDLYIFTNVLISKNYVFISTGGNIYILDMISGKELWRENDFTFYNAISIIDNTRFIYYSANEECSKLIVNEVDNSGSKKWSFQLDQEMQNLNMIIYSDGIVLSHNKGITLVDNNGNLKWEFNNKDFGYNKNECLYEWQLVPCINGDIIAAFVVKKGNNIVQNLIRLKCYN
jgi:outer membrane protein assembly factor BamB